MKSRTNALSPRPKQRQPGRTPTKSKKPAKSAKQAIRVEKRVSRVKTKTGERPLPLGVSRVGNIKNNLTQPELHAHEQDQVHSLGHTHKNIPGLELPPPRYPLTTKNLQEHTKLTNPGEAPLPVMTESTSFKSIPKSEIERLENYGAISLDGQKWPSEIEQFIRDVVMKPRHHETPSADKIWKVWASARETSSEADMAMILAPLLMFRPEDEDSVSLCSDIFLNRKYVEHPVREELSLAQPKPDRVNGYVSNWKHQAGRLKPAFTMAEEITLREMVDLLHPEALFTWFSGEFKSATGRSLAWAILQNRRAGIAAVNHNRAFFDKAGVNVEMHDTAHFTIACDAESVVLYTHWYDSSNGIHYTKRVFKADLGDNGPWGGKSEQMVQLRKALRNILEWAMGPRLTMIKHAISVFDQRRAEAAHGKSKGKASSSSDSSGAKNGKSSSSSSSAKPAGRGNGQPPQQQQQQISLPLRRSTRLHPAHK